MKSFVYYPIYFLLLLFLLDKIFYLDFFQKEFIQEGNIVFYKQRELLLSRLQKDKNREKKKTILVFGDSRAYGFSEEFFTSQQNKKYLLYNFSAPQSSINYSLFMLEKMKKLGIRPDLIFLVLSPEGFDTSKGFIYDPFFRLASDSKFIYKYWEQFPYEDRIEWIKSRIFAILKVRPDIKLFLNRLRYGNLNQYKISKNGEITVLNLTQGEFLGYQKIETNKKKLKRDSIRIKNIYLNHFQISEKQFFFLEKFLQTASELQTETFIIWPKVYGDYKNYYGELELLKKWWIPVKKLTQKYNMKTVDFNQIIDCNFFYDASHQSTICFKPQLQLLLSLDK